jgi:type I restriction enzyme S subunit
VGGLMSRLVPKLRFKEFSGAWEEKKLGDIALLTSSKRIYLSDYVKKGIPFFRGKEISQLENNEIIEDLLYIDEFKYLEIKEKYNLSLGTNLLINPPTLTNRYLSC